MRRLSPTFMDCLQRGFLVPLTRRAAQDKDLNLEIRDNYLNIYFKGSSLLRLEEARPGLYRPHVDAKYLDGMTLADFVDAQSVDGFLTKIPELKDNVIKLGHPSLEIEYEQLIVRANNRERRNSSDYFIVDRQYATGGERFDLIGCFWQHHGRCQGQEVAPCILEVKFALNSDISQVHEQLERYYHAVERRAAAEFAEECEGVFRQKLELGLYEQPVERLAAMKTLHFAHDIRQFQFVLILIDYNPNSLRLCQDKLAALPFADQVKVFHTGFAMWEQSVSLVR